MAVVGSAWFIWIESRSLNPLIPLRFFKVRNFTGANLITALYFGAFGGGIFFLTLNYIQVQGYTAVQAGMASLPIMLSIFVLSSPMGRLADRLGSRPLMVAGGIISLIAYLLFMRLGIGDSYWTGFLPAILMFGIGVGIIIVPLTVSLLRSVPERYSGMAAGSNYAATRIGNMLAIAIFGAVMLSVFQSGLAERLISLELDADTQAELMIASRSLGGTQPPESLDAPMRADIALAVKEAYVGGFRDLMGISAGLVFFSILVAIWVMGPDVEPAQASVQQVQGSPAS